MTDTSSPAAIERAREIVAECFHWHFAGGVPVTACELMDALERQFSAALTAAASEARAAERNDVMRALYCSDDYDLNQISLARNFHSTMKKVRDGAPHSGDCTNKSHTCLVCEIAQLETRADAFLRTLATPAQSET